MNEWMGKKVTFSRNNDDGGCFAVVKAVLTNASLQYTEESTTTIQYHMSVCDDDDDKVSLQEKRTFEIGIGLGCPKSQQQV